MSVSLSINQGKMITVIPLLTMRRIFPKESTNGPHSNIMETVVLGRERKGRTCHNDMQKDCRENLEIYSNQINSDPLRIIVWVDRTNGNIHTLLVVTTLQSGLLT